MAGEKTENEILILGGGLAGVFAAIKAKAGAGKDETVDGGYTSRDV